MSRRISVSIAFWLLVGGGLTPRSAVDALNDGIEGRALRLWRDGIVVSPSHFRRHMSIGRYPNLPYCAAMVVPKEAWQTNPVFELDEEQIRSLVLKLAKPPRRKPTGRRPVYPWDKIDPLLNGELDRGTENVAAVVRAELEERNKTLTKKQKIGMPSVRQMQARVRRLRTGRDAR